MEVKRVDPLIALILSGGVAHEYDRTSAQLKKILSGVGITSTVTEDVDVLASEEMGNYEVVVLNCVRWTCKETPEWRAEWHFEMAEKNRVGLVRHLRSGRGLLALHAATICFDDWVEYGRILGACWEWGRSGHSPYQEHLMKVRRKAHPIVAGIQDFTIEDELYTNLVTADDIDPLITAEWEGQEHPMLWVKSYDGGRVCYCALGHGPDAFRNESFQLLLQRSVLWVARKSFCKDNPISNH